MAAPASELGWVVHFAPVVRFTPLSPTYYHNLCAFVVAVSVGCRLQAPEAETFLSGIFGCNEILSLSQREQL